MELEVHMKMRDLSFVAIMHEDVGVGNNRYLFIDIQSRHIVDIRVRFLRVTKVLILSIEDENGDLIELARIAIVGTTIEERRKLTRSHIASLIQSNPITRTDSLIIAFSMQGG